MDFKIDLRKFLFWLRCQQSFFYFLELRFGENFCGRQMTQAEMHNPKQWGKIFPSQSKEAQTKNTSCLGLPTDVAF
ncbi:hypothetical protein XJ18_18090 [Bacillus pumilus]|nr:hypothetical protein XJ18_18090 [Bacillus pumilus]